MTIARLLAPVLLLAAAMSCSNATGPQQTDLARARQRWRSQDLHTYAFTMQRSCFCAYVTPLYVAVVRDTVAGVIDLESGQAIDTQMGETVEALFTFIQTAIDRPAHVIRAEYDAAKGFPTGIVYDGSEQIADDEITYHISDVHPISP